MSRLNEIAEQPSPAEISEVETYAESLAARHRDRTASTEPAGPNRIDLDGLDGLLTRVNDDMPWPEIKKCLRNDFADAADD